LPRRNAVAATRGPFDVLPKDLEDQTAESAVLLLRELLITEAKQIGLPVTGVSVPTTINVADGGVDAEIVIPGTVTRPIGLIGTGTTRYQVKTGKFQASKASEIRELVLAPAHRKAKPKYEPEDMQPRVRSCLEAGGLFVVVLFTDELVGMKDDYGVNELRAFLATIDKKFRKARIRIVRANELCGAISSISPGLALELNRLGRSGGSPLHDTRYLEESCGLAVGGYKPTESLTTHIATLRSLADNPVGFKHVRVLGDAGAGKTHLVFEAIKDNRHVLYCNAPDELDTQRRSPSWLP
jgi:hypothetical protein